MTRDEHCSAFLSSPGVRVVGRAVGLIRPTLVPKSRRHRAEMKCYCSKAPRPSFVRSLVRWFFLAKKCNNLTNNKKRRDNDKSSGDVAEEKERKRRHSWTYIFFSIFSFDVEGEAHEQHKRKKRRGKNVVTFPFRCHPD